MTVIGTITKLTRDYVKKTNRQPTHVFLHRNQLESLQKLYANYATTREETTIHKMKIVVGEQHIIAVGELL